MKTKESQNAERTHASAFDQEGPQKDGKSMSPPAFQLKVAGDANAEAGSGESSANGLPKSVQAKMEQTLGADFSGVQIHKNSSKASEVGALAYTQGKEVHFAPGQFKPETQSGQELIGHELTHVVQQQKGQVKPTTEINGVAVNDDAGLESEADQMGAKAANAKVEPQAGGGAKLGGAGGGAIQAKFNPEAAPKPEQKEEGTTPEHADVPAKEAGDEVDPAVRMAQELAAEAGDMALAALPDQKHGGEAEGGAKEGAEKEGQENVQRKAAGGPVVQRWGWLKKIWGGVKKAASTVWGGVKAVGKGIAKGAGYVWQGVKAVGGYVWNVVKSIVALGHAMVIKVWPRIWKLIVHLGTGAADLLKWLWTGIKTTFTKPGDLGKWFVDGLIGGAAWVGRLVTKLLDIAGLAEWLDFLGQVIKVNSRSLTSVEIKEAKKVLGNAVPYWKVRVDEASIIAKIANWGGPGMGVTIGYTVNFSKGVSPAPGNGDMHWLIHELTHVAQCESRGLQYIPEALIAQHTSGYGYGGPAGIAGKHLADFNREQQGDICADYYGDVLYGSTPATNYQPLIDEAKQGKF